MRNIFLVYMPPNNIEAMAHYRDTIQEKVSFERVASFLTRDDAARLKTVFGPRPIAVWGSRDGTQNRARFERMAEGDDLLIVEGANIRFIGKIALKVVSAELSRELWANINPKAPTANWNLIYFIANPLELNVPFSAFCRLFGYAETYQLQGFSSVSEERINQFYERYDDLYSILIKAENHQPIAEKETRAVRQPDPAESFRDDADADTRGPLMSEHVSMQCKLAYMGKKAGQNIWVPRADQARLKSACNFSEFEPEFSTGIDLPRAYFENIDVVWKEGYRIDAVFEVENSTAIYSGLLRFADLNVVAPNTVYPMFIVAPTDRRNRVRSQVQRQVFRKLGFHEKVKLLTYEAIERVEQRYSETHSGFSVKALESESESFND
jgi:hypothetical protein